MPHTPSHVVLHQPMPAAASASTNLGTHTAPVCVIISTDAPFPAITYWGEDFTQPGHAQPDGTQPGHAQPGDEPLCICHDSSTCTSLFSSQQAQLINAGIDQPEFISLLPTQSHGWTGSPMIVLSRAGRTIFPQFHVTDHTVSASAYKVQATSDDVALTISVTIDDGGLVVQQAEITNLAKHPLCLERLRLAFPLPSDATELLTFTGHHLRERAPQRQPLAQGSFSHESWVGRPDFSSGFITVAGTPDFDFTHGTVYGVHTAWSGNVETFAERTPYSQGIIGGAELLHPGEVILAQGESYRSPRVIGSWATGLTRMSHRFHAAIRRAHTHSTRRPTTLNTWEAVYFQQTPHKLEQLATTAAQLGVQRFVVDDGWFRGRRNDSAALGDWFVDSAVWPNGLTPLSDHVHRLGMEFGLWFEPEMISLNSDTARQHPEWVLRPTDSRFPLPGRHEYVLDLANPEAFTYIASRMSALIRELGIDAIKWDHNRFITEAISPYSGQPAVHGQTCALYRLLRELKAQFPALAIENCASGGGRVDLAMMELTDSVWTSDCTDPLERIDIQRYTSLLVPPEMLGAHIAASPSHQTGRSTSLTTRAATAFLYGLGFELDLDQLGDLDRWLCYEWVELHHAYITGQMIAVHGDGIDPAVRVDGVLDSERQHGVYCVGMVATSAQYPIAPVQLPGLRADTCYRVRPLGGAARYADADVPGRGNPQWWNDAGAVIPGAVLSRWGIRTKHIFPGSAVLLEVSAVR
ncbi:MAG: alpha-galactosidase [Arcanobacterium sp.]|nr:alpha-galactosidase [Arcanobacterium sp.]